MVLEKGIFRKARLAIDRGLKAKGHSLKDIRGEGEVWKRGNGEEEVIEAVWW